MIDSAGNEIAPVAPGDSFGDEDISLITVDAGGPYAVDEGESITLTGTVTHAEGGDVSFLTLEWDTDGNGAFESPGASATFVGEFVEADTDFPAGFRACNSRSECVTDAVNITVRDTKPVVEAGGPYTGEAGSSIELVGSCVGCTSVEWDLDGDGNFETPGETVTFAASPDSGGGTFTVTLRGCDSDDCVTDTAIVNVLAREPLEVQVDVKPGDRRNSINLRSRGVIPVAILSDPDFDAVAEIRQKMHLELCLVMLHPLTTPPVMSETWTVTAIWMLSCITAPRKQESAKETSKHVFPGRLPVASSWDAIQSESHRAAAGAEAIRRIFPDRTSD